MKTSTCRDGTLKNQPNKMGTTPQYFYTIPTSCAILPTTYTTKPFKFKFLGFVLLVIVSFYLENTFGLV